MERNTRIRAEERVKEMEQASADVRTAARRMSHKHAEAQGEASAARRVLEDEVDRLQGGRVWSAVNDARKRADEAVAQLHEERMHHAAREDSRDFRRQASRVHGEQAGVEILAARSEGGTDEGRLLSGALQSKILRRGPRA